MLLFLALLPANVSAALRGVTLRGEAATTPWLRIPLQALFIAAAAWTAIHRAAGEGDRTPFIDTPGAER